MTKGKNIKSQPENSLQSGSPIFITQLFLSLVIYFMPIVSYRHHETLEVKTMNVVVALVAAFNFYALCSKYIYKYWELYLFFDNLTVRPTMFLSISVHFNILFCPSTLHSGWLGLLVHSLQLYLNMFSTSNLIFLQQSF